MNEIKTKKYLHIPLNKLLILGLILVGLGFLIGMMVTKNKKSLEATELHSQNSASNPYAFISPLLECNNFQDFSNKLINKIKQVTLKEINTDKENGMSSHVSVYFRDLNNGPWFGFNEKEEFVPGSLLKVPLMISAYKISEQDPSLLDKKVLFEKKIIDVTQHFEPLEEIKLGQEYTIDQLVRSMIINSDNEATLLLGQEINQNQLMDIYSDLGIDKPTGFDTKMAVRTYASFFRVLFNATYLSKDFSEKALSLLSQTDFNKGLRAGVPSSIKIAHKFGERTSEGVQLHDCGIIYYPLHPYVLCIMTRGNDYDQLAKVVKNISNVVYKVIDDEYKTPYEL